MHYVKGKKLVFRSNWEVQNEKKTKNEKRYYLDCRNYNFYFSDPIYIRILLTIEIIYKFYCMHKCKCDTLLMEF
jgi:hypothetical protein